ncbi:MAG: Membrane protein involved in the export of O-antigen, teichoic acid lipoteichoic acids [uncultured Sulfurovum sp.]|uniref:Membrane protein involved in the export of O-antigen, teichoic acid lipoteichoic acids n=1 Tax=uncultured Sulfurovum sp. TaxID=269237 RepID=A0A6S6T916_9BACT|nr:MAG: Membrane protein involved in the export of O-antigen, teichoic acid lipoteichoic acids [uncultured Sulfurovum sp.]
MIERSDKKRLLSNFFSLASLQGVNYILPLLTFPYLVRVLGIEYFGLLAFATALISYFNIITDYGFNLTATREISIHRENKEKVIEIFSAVMSIKMILMIFSFLLLASIVFTFDKLAKDWEVYLISFGLVIGQALFPVWFFQGMEKMKYITYLNIVAKSIFTVAIFVFVQEKSDFYLVPLFTSLGFVLVGFWSLWIIHNHFNVQFRMQSSERLKHYLVDGWDLFKAQMFVNLYRATNVLLLGILTNTTTVGYYSIAERIINVVVGLFIPANQAIYPFMAKLYQNKKIEFMLFLKKVSFVYLGISSFLFLIMYIFTEEIIIFVNGSMCNEIEEIYYILLFLIFTTPFSTLYGQVMVTKLQSKKISQIVRDIMILNIILVPLGIMFWNTIGMVIVVVALQYFIIWRYFVEIYRRESL